MGLRKLAPGCKFENRAITSMVQIHYSLFGCFYRACATVNMRTSSDMMELTTENMVVLEDTHRHHVCNTAEAHSLQQKP